MRMWNPYGGTEWHGAWGDQDSIHWTDEMKAAVGKVDAEDGIFWMCLEDMMKYFHYFDTLEAPGKVQLLCTAGRRPVCCDKLLWRELAAVLAN